MAKPSKKKNPVEPISVSKIYETIQAKEFLRELWWDLISDIQEKPTYQRLKAMVTEVINNTMTNMFSKPFVANEDMQKRTELTEISIMTYTLDTVISEVLYRRYQNEFEYIVKNLIKDLLNEKAKETPNPVKNDSVFENIERIFEKETPRSKVKKEKAVSEVKKSQISNSEDVEEFNVAPARKRGRPKKTTINEEKTENVNAVPKRKRGRPSITPEKCITASFEDKVNHKVRDQESDAESEISIGNISMDSVSSVHTSELSSFEDTISICSDDGRKKKHIPLKVANEIYLQGKLSQIYHFGKRSERLKLIKEAAASSSKDNAELTMTNDSSSGDVNSSARKVLPQRIRKPNPKYNSETMYCDVKDYSSPSTSSGSSSSQDEMDNKSFGPPKVQRKRKRSSLDKGTAFSPASKSSALRNASSTRNISASKGIKTNISSVSKTSTKCYETSDLYKPRPVTGNIVGSRSAAV